MTALFPIRRIAKATIRRMGLLPYRFGSDVHEDIRRYLPHQRISLIFDIGANDGQTVAVMKREYPAATMHCFEPNPACCRTLSGLYPGVHVHNVALGENVGRAGLDRSRGASDQFFLSEDLSGETVQVDTVDHFCTSNSIERVGFLKIDTEGHDLNVILGAAASLSAQRIDLLQAEVSMNCDNTFHNSFFDIQVAMEGFGYRLFGVYEQFHEWPTRQPNLRRSDVVYISREVIASNRG